MRRRSFTKSSGLNQYVPFGLFGGHMSGMVFLGVSLLLMLVSAVKPAVFDHPRSIIQDAVAPALVKFSVPFVHVTDGFDYLFSLTQLNTEVEKLRIENKRLEEWYATAQLLLAENQSLRGLMRVTLDPSFSFFTTRVIADVGGVYSQSLMIKGGLADRVGKDDVVLGGEGVIGRVTAVQNNSSTVLLITDLNSRIPVRIEKSGVQAILAGTNGDRLLLDRLPEDSRIENGLRVLTSGVGGVFPPDLPIGVVRNDPDGRVAVSPYADFSRLVFVRVVRQPDSLAVPQTPVDVAPTPNPASTAPTAVPKPKKKGA